MKLQKILKEIEYRILPENLHLETVEIAAITFDSRKVEQNSLFVAVKGENFDGHSFIREALKKGASAIVGENIDLSDHNTKIPFISVRNSRKTLAYLAAAFYGYPSSHLKVIGITGTDGKTTTASIIYQILDYAHKKTGLISTLQARLGIEKIETGLHTTTPDAVALQRFLKEMIKAKSEYAILETSSHGLAQYRAEACEFDVAVLTNFSTEHLDYHKNINEYKKAKGKLFQYLNRAKKSKESKTISVLNRDEETYDFFSKFKADISVNYGINSDSDYSARKIDFTDRGTKFYLNTPRESYELHTYLLGKHNVYNILAAIAVCDQLAIKKQDIIAGIARIKRVKGRLEQVEHNAGNFNIFIDFAHTPNGLKNVLQTVRKFTKNKIHVVFGSPGFRDTSNREPMGETAALLADKIYITADDPRTESLQKIMNTIAEGCKSRNKVEGRDYWLIPEREKAIEKAILSAEAGDTVITCGKAPEKSMAIGTKEIPWDEYAVVNKICREK